MRFTAVVPMRSLGWLAGSFSYTVGASLSCSASTAANSTAYKRDTHSSKQVYVIMFWNTRIEAAKGYTGLLG